MLMHNVNELFDFQVSYINFAVSIYFVNEGTTSIFYPNYEKGGEKFNELSELLLIKSFIVCQNYNTFVQCC